MSDPSTERMAGILGLGIDTEDGHTRITRGDGFAIYLGSERSHEEMQRLCLAIQRTLEARGKTLGDLTREEFTALVAGIT